ncbi:hypothetical protein QBC40DRAFT_188432 [Triangularia verruculosa]|uniref:Uncharacterized protein n=1 Tax=Triangularia verruculosa TaxID=2587418 RepID=A0AAN6X930_9PEZI|nr:hypothetical protein QBC40DRAFT_188432 [Triangularia verruculosa]
MAASITSERPSTPDPHTPHPAGNPHADVVPATPTVALITADDEVELPKITQDQRVDTGESESSRRTALFSGWSRITRRPSVSAAPLSRPASLLQQEPPSPTPSRHGEPPQGISEEKTAVHAETETIGDGNLSPVSQASYSLEIFPPGIRPRTSVDIIAVHDFDETPEEAWVMPVESAQMRLLNPGRPDGERDRTASPGLRDGQRAKVADKKGKGPELVNQSDASQRLDVKLRPPGKDVKKGVRSLEPSMRSSSEFDIRGRPRAVNWIRDFIPNDITDSRVLSFTYSAPTFDKKTGNWADYVESAAKALLEHFDNSRQLFFQRGVPVVFVGSGFGGIIVQKAISLAAKQDGVGSLTLDDIYQVLLLDTPFPEPDEPAEEDKFKSWFPKNTNVRMSRILLEIETRDKDSKLVEDVWKEYQGGRKQAARGLVTTWLYSQARVQQGDGDNLSLCKDEDEYRASGNLINFTSVAIYRHRRLARMADTQDYIYRTILAKMQSVVLYQAIKASNEGLVESILDSKPYLIYKTDHGRNPLHVACLMERPSETIVTLLINERPDDTIEPDDGGEIPLHHAVFQAWYNEPEEGKERSEYSGVIRYLMRNMQREDLDMRDNEERTPWDGICEDNTEFYCTCNGPECAATWIRELRENLEPITGPAITQDHDLPTEPTPPAPDSSQYIASFRSEGTVSEFYHTTNKKTKRVEEQINLKTTSVYEMVYDANKRCARILESSRRKGKDKDFRCRWILLPANNVSSSPMATKRSRTDTGDI